MPTEIQLRIKNFVDELPSKYCWALTCKRALKLIASEKLSRAQLALQANSTKIGPWEQELILVLNRGWVSKDKVKLCYACWRFMPYGQPSTTKYLSMVSTTSCQNQNEPDFSTWEIEEWLKDWTSETEDDREAFFYNNRYRCPICVLEGQDLRFKDKRFAGKEVFLPLTSQKTRDGWIDQARPKV